MRDRIQGARGPPAPGSLISIVLAHKLERLTTEVILAGSTMPSSEVETVVRSAAGAACCAITDYHMNISTCTHGGDCYVITHVSAVPWY